MRTAQLTYPATAIALVATMACNRADTNEQTQRATAEVKTAAARAGDKLSDGWLTTRIQAQYFADDHIKARYIDVTTNDKVVTIKGFVDSQAARERALQIARSTTGVKQVNDELLIGQSPKAFEAAQRPVATTGESQPAPASNVPVEDAEVTNSIQAKFFMDPDIKARHIQVDSRGGVVTLDGEVSSEAERANALLLARTATGVQRVEDHLKVNAGADGSQSASTTQPFSPQPTAPRDDASAAAGVKSSFASDPQLKGIDVTVQNGVAQLQGTVASAAARQRALDLARQTDGVTQVIDRLELKSTRRR
jgi:hyperosmotically inducible protein